MSYDEGKVFSIIDEVAVQCMNNESQILGKHKREISIEDIRGRTRLREAVVTRQLCHYISTFVFNDILRANFSRGYIGKEYERDHAAIFYSIKTIKDYQFSSKQVLYMTAYCMDEVTRRALSEEIYKDSEMTYSMLYPAFY